MSKGSIQQTGEDFWKRDTDTLRIPLEDIHLHQLNGNILTKHIYIAVRERREENEEDEDEKETGIMEAIMSH